MEELKQLLGEELYNQVKTKIDAHNGDEANKDNLIKLANLSKGEYVGKGKYDSLETDLTSKNDELAKANSLIEELKKATKGNEETEKKIKDYQNEIETLKEQNAKEHLDNALKIALLEAKATDIDYLTYKLGNQELKLDDNGKIEGIEDKIKELKSQFPNQFEITSTKTIQENKLPENVETGKITKETFDKMSYNERNKLFQENNELYQELSK